jgi:hypothetical protein
MSMMVITIDGKIYMGATADAVVARMREGGIFTFGKTNAEYMRFVSRQAMHLCGQFVRHDTPDNFLHDMHSNFLLNIKTEAV